MSIYFQHNRFLPVNHSVKHGFFGSQGGVSKGLYTALNCGLGSDDNGANVRANRVMALEALGLDKTYLHNVHQIHSATCRILDEDYRKNFISEGDALCHRYGGAYDQHPNRRLRASLILWRKEEGGAPVIGAAHAGWKGAVGGVLESTVHAMVQKGAALNTIKALIGPTIGPESYEVGTEFKDNLVQKDKQYANNFHQNGAQIFFDLPSFCEQSLSNAGVQNIFHKNLDTFFNEDDFFSYRRATHRKDKDYGRQISMIAIT